jgi:uncharacterized membrane protein YqjE
MTGSPHIRAILDLVASHRELSSLEWLECRRIMGLVLACLVGAIVSAFVTWLAINAAVVIAFRGTPLRALAVVIAINGVVATACAFQVRRLLRRPLFSLTKQEAARDVRTVLAALT